MAPKVTRLSVPRSLRPNGVVYVKETPTIIEALIRNAKRDKRMHITLTEIRGKTESEFAVKYAFINGWEVT